jgi:hypothetical protein
MISTRIHGILDYLLGALLVFSPWVLGYLSTGVETWVPVTVGAVVVFYSLFTHYELGVIRLLSLQTHAALDGIAGGFLALSPWLLNFSFVVWGPHLVIGLLLLLLALFADRVPSRPPEGL